MNSLCPAMNFCCLAMNMSNSLQPGSLWNAKNRYRRKSSNGATSNNNRLALAVDRNFSDLLVVSEQQLLKSYG